MNENGFINKVNRSLGLQLIITGLTALVEDEGHTPHEAFRLLDDVKRSTFHALAELHRERDQS